MTAHLYIALALVVIVGACSDMQEPAEAPSLGSARQSLVADPQGAAAVHARLASITLAIRDEYFAHPLDPEPLTTADGVGAFLFFEGASGMGAIYSDPNGLVWDAYSGSWVPGRVTEPIYGAFLSYWLEHGYELALGYPTSPEYAERDDASSMREQRFGKLPSSSRPKEGCLRRSHFGGPAGMACGRRVTWSRRSMDRRPTIQSSSRSQLRRRGCLRASRTTRRT